MLSQNDNITLEQVNIFDSDMQTLVCPVNVFGVMGKGLALQFKQQVPGLFDAYYKACKRGKLKLRGLWVYNDPQLPFQVLCFPTKNHWKQLSDIDDIRANLAQLAEQYEELGITSIAIPPLGCGEGRLDFVDVLADIRSYLNDVKIPVKIVVPPR